MKVVVNGEPRDIAHGTTLETLLDAMDANRSGVAAAVDGQVVGRGQWPQTILTEGADIAVLTAVQGG